MARLSAYLILLLGYISSIGIAQASQLFPLWTRWEQEGRNCVTHEAGNDWISYFIARYIWSGNTINSRSIAQIEFNSGTGTWAWNGTPFNLIDDWGDITRDYRVRGGINLNPCSEAMGEWGDWFYTCNGCIGWNPAFTGGHIIEVEGRRIVEYPGNWWGSGGFWESEFGWPIESQEYMFYIPPTPDGIAKVVVQVEPDLGWWNSYNPSSGDYQLKGVAAKEGTRLRFELGDMPIGEVNAKLEFTPSAERFATEEVTWWDGGPWRKASEYTYKYLFYYGAYLVNRIAGIHSSKIPIYPSLATLGEEDSKTETLYPEIWIRPDKVDIEIMEAVTWTHIRHLRGVDPYKVEWDGKDDNGDIVGKGLYAIRVLLPPDNTHEYYDSVAGGPTGTSNTFRIDGGVSDIQPDNITFGYAGTSTDALNEPKDCKVYMNLYDDEFRLIKRLFEEGRDAKIGQPGYVSWDYRPYSPGKYYWTIWGEDSLGNQAHIRAGSFTVPTHTIQGTRDSYPEDMSGWDKEGAIVRVRQPALVAVRTDKNGQPEWAHTQMAEAVAVNLKNKKKMNYKLVGNTFHFVDGGYNPWVHMGLEASDIFYFAGHGAPSLIAARDDASTWHLYDSDIVHNKILHEGPNTDPLWTILMPYGYHFVEIDGCSTGADYNQLPSKFIPESFLGWGKSINFPWNILDDFLWSLHGRNAKNWTKRFWDTLGEGKSVNDAAIWAGKDWTTRNVQSFFGLRIHGNQELYLK
jgi:hypothetical protein